MDDAENRRNFLKKGTAATVGTFGLSSATAGAQEARPEVDAPPPQQAPGPFDEYSRTRSSYGGPPDSDRFFGKLVPGRRGSDQPPVPFEMPDVVTLPWRMVDGVKEYRIVCEHVRRELLPGYWMDLWGYNGSVPGPTIEANQGDRVRLIVENRLPEPTTVHWHGLELPIQYDGPPHLVQDPIEPGGTFVYEFDLHQAGTFFYHSHIAMQEAIGMVGYFIIHPARAFDPPVDRDIGLIFQNYFIPPNQTVPNTMAMEWNWHTINGRSGPYSTPIVVRHGDRVRLRILDFSPMQHHPIHLHGHTFWITGREGARIPTSAWQARNTELIAVAQATDLEFVANNPGDWLLHCHMVHHMMNHMVKQVGPRIRDGVDVTRYFGSPDDRPRPVLSRSAAAQVAPGYPQMMMGMEMTDAQMHAITNRRETLGMRKGWPRALAGLMTVVRVLPDDLFDRVMHSDEDIPPGSIFDELVRRTSS